MASVIADAAASKQHSRRPPPRIVPAIPHRLARTVPVARPITPDESSKDTTPQHEPEADLQAAAQKRVDAPGGEQQQQAPLETPMTPDSKNSTTEKSEAGAPVPIDSPATSREDNIEVTKPSKDFDQTLFENDANLYPHESTSDREPAPNGLQQPPMPVELPPPFYPSGHIESQSHNVHTSTHGQARLSAGAVVFQASQGLMNPPARTQNSNAEPTLEQASAFRPPPGLALPQHGHGLYFSDYHYQGTPTDSTPWNPYVQSVGSGDTVHEAAVEYSSSQFAANASGNGFDNALKSVPPKHDSHNVNNNVTSQPQSFPKASLNEVGIGRDGVTEPRAVLYQNGAPSLTEHIEGSPFELAAYLSSQFGNPEFADFFLQVRSLQATLLSIPVHGIVVSRSPVAAAAIRRSAAVNRTTEPLRVVDIHAANPFVTRESLEESIKVLYGGPLLSPHNFLFGVKPYAMETQDLPHLSDIRKRMEQILSYTAAAETLQMPSMQARGVEIARLILRWDTVDQLLQYALHGLAPIHQSTDNIATSEDPFATALVSYVVEFIAHNFPVDFSLYAIAPELYQTPRLPIPVEARHGAHNSRLSKIRFGEAPLEDDYQPSQVTRMLSTILLTVPTSVLERLFNHRATANRIGWTGIGRIMRSVVAEREDRRCKVLHNSGKQSADRTMSAAFTHNIHSEECVQQIEPSQIYPSGLRITTTWVTSQR